MSSEELYNKTTEELYDEIVETLSSGNFLTLNGKPINLSELSDYINAQQQEIERLNKELEIEKDISDGMLETIDKALHKLRASKDHFKTERENNVVTFVIRILEGNDK